LSDDTISNDSLAYSNVLVNVRYYIFAVLFFRKKTVFNNPLLLGD
jgi:hypothetical protein